MSPLFQSYQHKQTPDHLDNYRCLLLGTFGSLWARFYTLEETIWCSRERADEAKHKMLLHLVSISLTHSNTVMFFFKKYCEGSLYHPSPSYMYFKGDITTPLINKTPRIYSSFLIALIFTTTRGRTAWDRKWEEVKRYSIEFTQLCKFFRWEGEAVPFIYKIRATTA